MSETMRAASAPSVVPAEIKAMLGLAAPCWQPVLLAGLEAMAQQDPGYLSALARDTYLPSEGRMFAAFAQPMAAVRYVLVGEGPYPRADSATGVCFMDGAVQALWSEKGLSKQVNRATSLRNFMKMLLVTEGRLSLEHTTGAAMEAVAQQARAPDSPYIQTLPQLQDKLTRHGFLLLNATLVFRPLVPPPKEAKAWRPFLQTVLAALAQRPMGPPPTLVLWGKVAEQLRALPETSRFPQVAAEHPYNLSFIGNPAMHQLFAPMQLLRRDED